MIEELYEIYSKRHTNFLLSPYSIHIALAMAKEGALGVTLEQMTEVMGEDPVTISSDTLSVANAIWTRCHVQPDWLNTIKTKYNGRATDIRSIPSPEDMINNWVSVHTKNKIDKILDEPLKPDDKMVITNAIHFKDDWRHQFKEKNTKKDQFYISEDDTVEVDMMHLRGHDDRKMYYAETEELQVLEMRYTTDVGNDKIVMNIMLPKSRTGRVLPADVGNIGKIMDMFSNAARFKIVDLWMPKLKMECKYSLKSDLIQMGMPIAFTDSANFKNMSLEPSPDNPELKGLKIGDVLHKTYVDINEEGTEAAAVTGIVMRALCASMPMPEERIKFRVDHPYVFLIRHVATDTILFMGVVNNPSTIGG